VFDDVWETIQERYYDPTFRGLDWEATRVAFRPVAAEAKNTQDFYELLRRMIAPLKDPHTRVFSPEEKFDWWNPKFVTIGITVREVEGSPTVVHVEPKSAANAAGVRVGDVVVAVDNVNAAEIIERRTQHADISAGARLRLVRGLFDGNAGTPLTLTWKRKDGRIKSATLERYWSQRALGFRSSRHDDLVIITLDAFTQTIASDFLKQLPEMIGGARGIILDLRGNGGGDAEAMANVASAFLDTGINLGKFADRSGSGFELVTTPRLLPLSVPIPSHKLPMVVLTSENTSSAAEILASTLQQQRRARVIGSMTCGCVLAIRNRHTLPDGGVLDVSEFDYKTAEGIRLEGVGITPNDTTALTRADLYAKRDSTLERAKKYFPRAIN
jgi:carboxyl-terminal processing protease